MPSNAFRERMESYLKAVEQTATDTFSSTGSKKKVAKNPNFKQQDCKLEISKENNVVGNESFIKPPTITSVSQINRHNEEASNLNQRRIVSIETSHDPSSHSKVGYGEVSQTTTAISSDDSPPIQLMSPSRQASNNSAPLSAPAPVLNQSDGKQQGEKNNEIVDSEFHQEESKVASSLKRGTSKEPNEMKDSSGKQQESSIMATCQTSQQVVEQRESPSAQIQANEISVPLISVKLKQKFLEYQLQRQQTHQQQVFDRSIQKETNASATESNIHSPDFREPNDLYLLETTIGNNVSSVNHEIIEARRDDEMASRQSIQNEIAALREILESYKEKYAKDSLLSSSQENRKLVTPMKQGDEGRLNVPTTNHISLPCKEVEVLDAETITDKQQQQQHSEYSSSTVTPWKTPSRQEQAAVVQEESLPSSCCGQEFVTNTWCSAEDDKFCFRFFFDRQSKHIQRLESCLLEAYKGDMESFLGLVSETPSRNYLDLLFYCLDRLWNEGHPESATKTEHIQKLERKIVEEQSIAEKHLGELQTKQATLCDEIQYYQAKLSRTQLALQVALTEKRHLERRYPSLKICGSMEEEIGKLESRQEQRERQLQLRLSQKNRDIQQLEEMLSERDKEIGLVYSEITELLMNIEQVQDALKVAQ